MKFQVTSSLRAEGGFVFHKQPSGQPLLTPRGALLVAPTKTLAEAIVAEWCALERAPKVGDIPVTAYLNTSIDLIAETMDAVRAACLAYIDTELLCYRAGHDAKLLALQNTAWQPWLDWCAKTYGAHFELRHTILAEPQDNSVTSHLAAALLPLSPLELLVLRELSALYGSLVLGLAVFSGALEGDDAYKLSVLEETYQRDNWGRIEEHDQAEHDKRAELQILCQLLSYVKDRL